MVPPGVLRSAAQADLIRWLGRFHDSSKAALRRNEGGCSVLVAQADEEH
jgi:hypothetical protein